MFSSKDIFFGSQASGYRVSNSLRFRSSASAYLNRTPASASNRTTWTWSAWVKRGAISSAQLLFSASETGSSSQLFFSSGDLLTYFSGSATINLVTTQVFRDPSAWYHIVCVLDTTQATSSNRVKLYVNGAQITAFGTATYPAQNATTGINNNVLHGLAVQISNGAVNGLYLDGYLAEVNFIDGQALTPSSFGAFDTNGVWQPKAYVPTGTGYGTNGFYLPFSLNSTSTYAGTFNGSSQYLSWTSNMSGLQFGTGDFTIEAWVNKSANGTNNYDGLMQYGAASQGADGWYFEVSSSRGIYFTIDNTVVNAVSAWTNDSQWHHVAVVRQSGTVTLYKDGIAQTSGALSTSVPTTGTVGKLGESYNGTTHFYFNGLISNARIVKGTAVYTANFVPSSSALTAITNTQLLTLQSSTIVDNSTNATSITNTGTVTVASATPFAANITSDASGSNNNWAANNINYTSSGTTYDSMIDSPTNYADGGNGRGNYATLNPNGKLYTNAVSTVSNGNLTATGSGTILQGTMATSTSGKYYFEMTATTVSGTDDWVGFILASATGSSGVSSNTLLYRSNGQKYFSSWATYGNSWSSGNVIGCAIDLDNGAVYFAINNTWQTSGVPTSGSAKTGAAFTDSTVQISGVSWGIIQSLGGVAQQDFNFGQRPFAYTPPSGYSALNTQNLTTPTITNGAQYMAATTYTGTGSSLGVTNGGNNNAGTTFQPDFVWIKSRSNAYNHSIFDSVRGATKQLSSDATSAEATYANSMSAFNNNGFQVISDASVNGSGATFVGWQWKGGNGTSNIAVNAYGSTPSIASTVSANTSAGFSVVTYTGNQTAGATVGHGLGVAPSFIFVKCRGLATSWPVYHSAIGATNWLLLNGTQAQTTSAQEWNNTAPTSTVFSLGSSVSNSNQSSTYVAYCFAPVAGYSAFGSYTGNASTDGPFVYTGFRPRWLLLKNTADGTTSWAVYDTSRTTYNIGDQRLCPDLANAESTVALAAMDILSNGFKIRTSGGLNGSTQTIIYAAFAENPFKISRAR